MMKLFGTDGIRAVAGLSPLDHITVYRIGSALTRVLGKKEKSSWILIGRDTRQSGAWLEKILFQGIRDAGGHALSVGVIPTSAVSYLTKKHAFSAGIVISASHNPFEYNGIKIFDSSGRKIPEIWEKEIEIESFQSSHHPPSHIASPPSSPELGEEYLGFLQDRFRASSRTRLKLVADCSYGAASAYAGRIFSSLGFDVHSICDQPNGKNINLSCGSLHPQLLMKEVISRSADLGVAYDGDADRVLWVDEQGRLLNGDHTLLILARHFQKENRMASDTVVGTIMTNLALELNLGEYGLKLHRSQVGDKYVLEDMIRLRCNLGGEQSGHTILLDDCPTGDGILTSLRMIEVLSSEGASMSELAAGYQEFPQIIVNVPVARKDDFRKYPDIIQVLRKSEQDLGQTGRLNLRYSGTEPLARVMVEGRDREQIESLARRIAAAVENNLNP
ncbi:MAG: phosphoglucosamine mutase [Candidatus Aminicenantes bacterium]